MSLLKGRAELFPALRARFSMGRLRRLAASDGQTLVEYGLILILIAVVVVVVLTAFGGHISSMFGTVSSKI